MINASVSDSCYSKWKCQLQDLKYTNRKEYGYEVRIQMRGDRYSRGVCFERVQDRAVMGMYTLEATKGEKNEMQNKRT